MGLFSDNKDEYVDLERDEERRATDYKFTPKVTEKELKSNGLKLVKSIDEWDGMELAEQNPRLLTLVITIMAEIERLKDAGEKTERFAKMKGELDEKHQHEIDAMVNKSSIAELAYMIDAYATNKFIIE